MLKDASLTFLNLRLKGFRVTFVTINHKKNTNMKKVLLFAATAFLLTGAAFAEGGKGKKKKKCAKGKTCCAKEKACCKKKDKTAEI